MRPVIGFSAYSGTGKTTLLEQVIPRLVARGVRVAAIKHDVHGIDPDGDGKDSGRLLRAGAVRVTLIGPEAEGGAEERLFSAIRGEEDADLILVEGFKYAPLPRIGLFRQACGTPLPEPEGRYLAVVTDSENGADGVRFGWDDVEELTDFLMEEMKKQAGAPRSEDFTHFGEDGRARMVDVGEKEETRRTATAAGRVLVNRRTFDLIRTGGMKKGDVLTVAQVAGIMGAKRTSELIPMCHPIQIHGIDLSLQLNEERLSVEIVATVRTDGRTGVEMEALTAVSAAALTVYDMCKAVQRDMEISEIRLVKKTGGIHGDYERYE